MSASTWNRSEARRAASRAAGESTKASASRRDAGRERATDARGAARSKRAAGQSAPQASHEGGWIGVDFAHFATAQPSRALLPLLVLALLVALAIASLRIDLIRTRYALAEAMASERRLIEEQHALIVEKLQGRDPVELAVLAKARGFKPATPARRIVDPLPGLDAHRFDLDSLALPQVAAGPPVAADAAGAADEHAFAETPR